MAKFGTYSEETTPTIDDLVLVKEITSGATKRVQLGNILPAGSVSTAKLANLAVTNAKINDVSTTKISNPYKFSAYATGNQVLPNGANTTKVVLNAEDFDTSASFDSTTQFRFTAPVAGFYQFDGFIHTATIGATRRIIPYLYKNGTELYMGTEDTRNADFFAGSVSGLVQLATNDYIEMFVYSSDGQALDGSTRKNRLTGFLVSTT